MHCLLEGLAHAHFREFLGLTADSAHRKSDTISAFDDPSFDVDLNKPETFTEKDVRTVKSIQSLLTEAVPDLEGNDTELIERHVSELERKLTSKKVVYLQFVSEGLGIRPDVAHPGKKVYKAHWVKSLIGWVDIFFIGVLLPSQVALCSVEHSLSFLGYQNCASPPQKSCDVSLMSFGTLISRPC
jgi:hypothetical protein